jgi:hypothetical protein
VSDETALLQARSSREPAADLIDQCCAEDSRVRNAG